jgi:hypothetical protein
MRIALSIVLLTAPNLAAAKCIETAIPLRGVVVDIAGVPAPNASLTATWKAWPQPGRATTRTDANGRFLLVVAFNSLSGEGLDGDYCDGKLGTITLVASDRDMEARLTVSETGSKIEQRLVLKRSAVDQRPNKSLERTREK